MYLTADTILTDNYHLHPTPTLSIQTLFNLFKNLFRDHKRRHRNRINNDIRQKMNLRFKLFKRAVSTKDQETYARYKKVRNEITSEIRNAKVRYFNEKLAEVKSAAANWNLIA